MLRVIAGTAKGHKLKTPKGLSTRPTTDRVKESLFSILAPYLAEASVLDAFAGTGSLGIEALSRGAESAVFIDRSSECARIIRDNLIHTKLIDRSSILTMDVGTGLNKLAGEGRTFDIIFMDPPYSKNFIEETLKIVEKNGIIKDDGIIIAEHDKQDAVPDEVGRLKLGRSQKYGDTVLSFYSMND